MTNGEKTKGKAAAEHVHVPEVGNRNTYPDGMMAVDLTYNTRYYCKSDRLFVVALVTPTKRSHITRAVH